MSLQGLNGIPIFGWIISLLLTASLAVPFWIAWTVFGIGSTYFYFLPAIYLTPSFWSIVGIFICVGTLKILFFPSFNVSNNTKVKNT